MPQTASMSPRLLSLLSSVEAELSRGPGAVRAAGRSADYRRGVARLSLADTAGRPAGGLVVQNFLLADGQLCVRARFLGVDGRELGEGAIYPTTERFDWDVAARRLAREWRVATAGVLGMGAHGGDARSAPRHEDAEFGAALA